MVYIELAKLLLALFLGLVVGIERELRRKPAGMRTYMLICFGACLFTILGVEVVDYFGNEQLMVDPIRVIQAIVIGVSFLGAGTILKDKKKKTVENLTTSAGIFVIAGVGITVALEEYLLAVFSTLLIIITNYLLLYLEQWIVEKSD